MPNTRKSNNFYGVFTEKPFRVPERIYNHVEGTGKRAITERVKPFFLCGKGAKYSPIGKKNEKNQKKYVQTLDTEVDDLVL